MVTGASGELIARVPVRSLAFGMYWSRFFAVGSVTAGALRVGQRAGIQVDALLVAKPFVAAEVERPVLHHGSAEVDAELLPVEQ